jgi:hypothetical protein
VEPGDFGRVPDRGQVDRAVPCDEEPDVIVDRPPRLIPELDLEGVEAVLEGVPVRIRQFGKVLDTPRERFSPTAQALLLWMCPPPSVRAAPGVLKSRTAGWVGLP